MATNDLHPLACDCTDCDAEAVKPPVYSGGDRRRYESAMVRVHVFEAEAATARAEAERFAHQSSEARRRWSVGFWLRQAEFHRASAAAHAAVLRGEDLELPEPPDDYPDFDDSPAPGTSPGPTNAGSQ